MLWMTRSLLAIRFSCTVRVAYWGNSQGDISIAATMEKYMKTALEAGRLSADWPLL